MKYENGMPRVVAAITVDDLFIGWKSRGYQVCDGKGWEVFYHIDGRSLGTSFGCRLQILRDDVNDIYLEATMDKKRQMI